MKSILLNIVLGLCFASAAGAYSGYHMSSMNTDVQISHDLYAALKEGFGSISSIQKADDGYTLQIGQEKLTCTISACNLNWDTSSQNSPKDSATFQSTLFDILLRWSQNGGKDEPSFHVAVYRQTGNMRLTLEEGNLTQDQVSCSVLNKTYKTCSLVISEITSGTGADLQKVFESLKSAPSLVDVQRQALLTSVQSDLFLPPGRSDYSNGLYEITHTLYTDMLIDQITATKRFAYKGPIRNAAGQVISNGIVIGFTGSLDSTGAFVLQQIQTQSYALAHHALL